MVGAFWVLANLAKGGVGIGGGGGDGGGGRHVLDGEFLPTLVIGGGGGGGGCRHVLILYHLRQNFIPLITYRLRKAISLFLNLFLISSIFLICYFDML